MKLKDLFEKYTQPVDESGWETISQDPALVRYNRGRRIRRICGYGIPAVVVTAALVTALTLGMRHAETPTPEVPTPVPQAAPAPVATPAPTAKTLTPSATATPDVPSPVTRIFGEAESPRTANVPVDAETQNSKSKSPSELQQSQNITLPAVVDLKPAPSAEQTESTDNTPTLSTPETTMDEQKSLEVEPEEPTTESQFDFFVPNAFTPNHDGLNDKLYITSNFEPRTYEMAIYNRRGEMVFHTRDLETGWAGTSQGKELAGEIYTYIIKYTDPDGKLLNRRGQVMLIR